MQRRFDELRARLDTINHELAALLEQRFEITDEIGELKKVSADPVRDRAREEAILEQIGCSLRDKEKYADVAEIFEMIFERSRARQNKGC